MALYPAVVESYDAQRRRVRISITGMTDGANVYPEAELLYPMGDSHNDTEIEIEKGDIVYVDFIIENDWRYPVVMGYRQPETGNLVGIRRWRHDRIELIADSVLIDCKTLQVTGDSTINKTLLVNQSVTMDQALQVKGNTQVGQGLSVQGSMQNNGTNVGSTHVHDEHGDGGGVTSTPR